MRSSSLRVLDLFCGCGGLSLGFKQAGFEIILGVDYEPTALRTYSENLKTRVLQADLSDKQVLKSLRRNFSSNQPEVIVAGPPCQGFSLTGPRQFDDHRNSLYLAVIDLVRELTPEAFLVENVPGLATLWSGQIKDEIVRRFSDLGYEVASPQILDAANYGVPQHRKRVFIVGVRKGCGRFSFPFPTHSALNYVTCEDALSDLPSRTDRLGSEMDEYEYPAFNEYQKMMRSNSSILHNHVATKHTDLVVSVISQVPEGGNYRDLPKGVGESRRFHEAWTRYHSKKPSRTIDTGHRNHFHYLYNRVPTIRENARLQSFPDDFIFYGTRTQQNRQVGDAVPPLLACCLGQQLQKCLAISNERISKIA